MSNLLDISKIIMEYIDNRVLKFRKEINATQEDLAKALKVSRQTIIAIEKGNYTPSLLLGIKVAKFFKKPVEEVFTYKQGFSTNK